MPDPPVEPGTVMGRTDLDLKKRLRWNSTRKTQTMKPAAIAYFSATLFLALTTLIKWKRRRDTIAARLNRGLRGYVEAKGLHGIGDHR